MEIRHCDSMMGVRASRPLSSGRFFGGGDFFGIKILKFFRSARSIFWTQRYKKCNVVGPEAGVRFPSFSRLSWNSRVSENAKPSVFPSGVTGFLDRAPADLHESPRAHADPSRPHPSRRCQRGQRMTAAPVSTFRQRGIPPATSPPSQGRRSVHWGHPSGPAQSSPGTR